MQNTALIPSTLVTALHLPSGNEDYHKLRMLSPPRVGTANMHLEKCLKGDGDDGEAA